MQELWAPYRDPRFARTCIVCTNVAESGVTIPNVGLGQRRVSSDIRTGSTVTVNALQTLSKAQLVQQQGRSGRTDQGMHVIMMSYESLVSSAIIALNRTIRDGTSYASCLTPIDKDWHIVNHWEDQFCRDVYQDLCQYGEMQHLLASALISPARTPQVCTTPQTTVLS